LGGYGRVVCGGRTSLSMPSRWPTSPPRVE
jgi:hypothetical protein